MPPPAPPRAPAGSTAPDAAAGAPAEARVRVDLLCRRGCPRARLLRAYLLAHGVEPSSTVTAPDDPVPAALDGAFSVVPALPAVVVRYGATTMTLPNPSVGDVHRALAMTPLRRRLH